MMTNFRQVQKRKLAREISKGSLKLIRRYYSQISNAEVELFMRVGCWCWCIGCYCWGGVMIFCIPTPLQLLIANGFGIFTRTWSMMFIHVYYVYKNVPRWLFRNYRIQVQTISKYEQCVRPRSKFCLQGRSQSAAPQTKWEFNWGLAVHIGCAWWIRGRCVYKMRMCTAVALVVHDE